MHTILVRQGRQYWQEEMGWGRYTGGELPSFSLFNDTYSIPVVSAVQQVWIAAGKWGPSGDWVVSSHPGLWDIPLQIPLDDNAPRIDGCQCSQQYSMLIHGESQSKGCLSPVTCIPLQCWMSQQGCPGWHLGQQVLLVDHSNPRAIL